MASGQPIRKHGDTRANVTGPDEQPTAASPDPRLYFAAERTLLAWIRTGIALMAFGFVVAKVTMAPEGGMASHNSSVMDASTLLGGLLVVVGIVVLLVCMVRQRHYIRAMEANRFREAFSLRFPAVLVATLGAVGCWLLYLLVTP
jgi:putative membrane protein